MNTAQAEALMARLVAYWPTPALVDEEAIGWVELLTDPKLDLTYSEVATALRRISYAGDVHRPRPGQVVLAVQSERRAQARLADTSKMLAEGRAGAVSAERTRHWVAACRRVLAGQSLDEAMAAEGIVA